MTCKFCGDDRPLVKAHVIPAGFFRRLRVGKQSLEMITNKAGGRTVRSPVGEYDRIVCSDCESIWQDWDTYAQRMLSEEPTGLRVLYHSNRKLCYVAEDYDYARLKLFFVSLLWRASASERAFFSRIKLGALDGKARQMIARRDPREAEDFSVVLSRYDHPLAKVMADPYVLRYSQVSFAHFVMGRYTADIKVDPKPTPTAIAPFDLALHRPLYIVCRDLLKSNDFKVSLKVIKESVRMGRLS